MSSEHLAELQRIRAFDPTVRFEELGEMHVPFDEMHGAVDVETRLSAAIRRGERVALVGTTGNGKSSTASYGIRPTDEDIAGFRIGVTLEEPELLSNPGRFAQHVVRRIARDAAEVSEYQRTQLQLEVTDVRELRPGRTRRGGAKINAKVVELSGELSSVSDSIAHRTSSHELVEALDHALELVRTTGASPVLVIDDSDTWIEVEQERLEATRRSFFGPIMRMLAERGCGLVVAVDEGYLGLPEYQQAHDGWLPLEIHIPRLASQDALALLLQRRLEQVPNVGLDDVFTCAAIARMFETYASKTSSLRSLMRSTSLAVYHAVAAGADDVGPEAVAASLRESSNEAKD